MRRRGLALILVVGVLAVLAVLGTAFTVLSRLERRAAQQRVLGTKDYDNPPSGIPDGKDGRVAFELSDTVGTAYAKDAAGKDVPDFFLDSRGERIGRGFKTPFRLHAVFQPNLYNQGGEAANKAILDPLALDDVTISYRPRNQPLVQDWREGE